MAIRFAVWLPRSGGHGVHSERSSSGVRERERMEWIQMRERERDGLSISGMERARFDRFEREKNCLRLNPHHWI